MTHRIRFVASLVLLAAAPAVRAQFNWIATGGGVFSTSTNWTPAGPPGAGQVAEFAQVTGTYTVTFTNITTNGSFGVDDGNVTFALSGQLYTLTSGAGVGSTAGLTGRLTLSNGTLSVTNNALSLGGVIGSTGFVTVAANAALSVTGSQGVIVGSLGTGTLTVQSGGTVSTTTFGVGVSASALGTATITGSGSTVNASGALIIGQVGTGSMTVSAGAVVNANSASITRVGSQSGSSGSLTVTGAGSQFNVTASALQLGESGSSTLLVSAGGVLTVGSQGTIIGTNVGGTGIATVTGAGSTFSSASSIALGTNSTARLDVLAGGRVTTGTLLDLGIGSGGTGTLNIDGAASQVTGGTQLRLGTSPTGTGLVNVSGGATLTSGAASLGLVNNAIGNQVNITGAGSTWTADVVHVGQAGGATVTLASGGAIKSNTVTLGDVGGGNGTVTLGGTGSTWTANGGFFIGGTSAAAGGIGVLNVNAGGSLAVTGETKIWNIGATALNMNGGTLTTTSFTRQLGAFNFNDGTLTVSGGVFNPNAAGAAIFTLSGNSATALATLKLSGPGTTTTNITNLVVGATNRAVVEVSNTAVLSTNGLASLGNSAGSSGTLTVTGFDPVSFANSRWTNNGQSIFIGNAGTGTLNVSDFGFFDNISSSVTFGVAPTGVGVANADHGTIFAGATVVGQNGRGTINVTNGGGMATSGNTDLGLNAGSFGTVNVSGTNSTLSTGLATRVAVAGGGRVNLSAGGTWFSNGLVTVGGTAFGQVTVGPGGHWQAGSITVSNSNGSLFQNGGVIDVFGTFNKSQYQFDDGALNVFGTFVNESAPNGFVLNGGSATALPTMTINQGGSTSNITVAAIGTSRSAALVVNGGAFTATGDITVGSAAGGNGSITINSGSLVSNNLLVGSSTGGIGSVTLNSGTISTNIVRVLAGSSLTINNNGFLILSDLDAGSLPLTFNSGGLGFSGSVTLDTFKLKNLLGPTPVLAGPRSIASLGTMTLTGPLTIGDGGFMAGTPLVNDSTLQIQGGLASATGMLTNNAGKTIVLSGAGQLSGSTGIANAGILQLNNNLVPTSGGTLTNTGTIQGTGIIGNTVQNSSGGTIQTTTGQKITFNGAVTNPGQLSLIGGEMQFTNGVTNSASTGLISGRDAILRFNGGMTNDGSMAFSAGTMDVYGKITSDRFVSATDRSRITVSGGGVLSIYGDLTILPNRTDVQASAAGPIVSSVVFFGSYNGGVTGGGAAFIEGDHRPGASPALVAFGGSVAYGGLARLQMEIGGTNRGAQYDSVDVTGAATLAGILDVDLINGFQPNVGQTFTVMTFASHTGDFTEYRDLAVGNGLMLVPSFTANSLILTVAPVPEPGTLALGGLAASWFIIRRRRNG
jgi:fibronectin-binding autotransporter adhesin